MSVKKDRRGLAHPYPGSIIPEGADNYPVIGKAGYLKEYVCHVNVFCSILVMVYLFNRKNGEGNRGDS
jgi:hypothetical protein